MQYIRLLHPKEWQAKENRFNRMAFRNYHRPPNGISIVDPACAASRSGSVCSHISRYYQRWSAPTIFWIFDSERLPEHRIEHTNAIGGDEWCHRDIHGLSDEDADKSFKADRLENKWSNYRLCRGEGSSEPLTEDGLIEWKTAHGLAL